MRNLSKALIALALFSCTAVLTAQEAGPRIVLSAKAEKEVAVRKDGGETVKRVPVEIAARGDMIVYTITYKNEGREPATGTSIVNPVPKGTTYIMESAKGKNSRITCSVDNGKYYQPQPAKYQVRKDDGTIEYRLAPAKMYTHIMWLIEKPLPAGSSGEIEFKVKVN